MQQDAGLHRAFEFVAALKVVGFVFQDVVQRMLGGIRFFIAFGDQVQRQHANRLCNQADAAQQRHVVQRVGGGDVRAGCGFTAIAHEIVEVSAGKCGKRLLRTVHCCFRA